MVSDSVVTIVLTTGQRPLEVRSLLLSVAGQTVCNARVLLVANGCEPKLLGDLDADFDQSGLELRIVVLSENVGIPAGRNFGMRTVEAAVMVFLDDDAQLLDDGCLEELRELFDKEPALAAVALHLVDEDGHTVPRHIPRLRKSAVDESGWVASFPGGAVAIRREAMQSVGGYADDFFYGMEETDLAVRLIDAGWKIWYAADLLVFHPRTEPSRHPDAYWRLARNRVWLAHRNFPLPVALVYLTLRALLTIARQPSLARSQWSGYRDGWRTRIGPRRAISWRTVWRLTRLGRPPIL